MICYGYEALILLHVKPDESNLLVGVIFAEQLPDGAEAVAAQFSERRFYRLHALVRGHDVTQIDHFAVHSEVFKVADYRRS